MIMSKFALLMIVLLLNWSAAAETVSSGKQEAEHYFAESQKLTRQGDYSSARKKLNAAMALHPKNYNYYKALLKLNKQEAESSGNGRKMVTALAENLKIISEMKKDFPQSEKLISEYYCNWYISNFRKDLTLADMKKMQKLAAVYRPVFLKNIKGGYYKFNLKDGINSAREWRNYTNYNSFAGRFALYWDAPKWCQLNYESALKTLKLAEKYYSDKPAATRRNINCVYWLFAMFIEFRETLHGGVIGKKQEQAVKNMILKSSSYIEKAKNNPVTSAKLCAAILALLRKTIISKYNEAEFEKNVREYYRQVKKLKLSPGSRKNSDIMLVFFLEHGSPLCKILWRVQKEDLKTVVAPKKKKASVPLADLANQIKKTSNLVEKARKVVKLMPYIRQYEAQEITNPEVRDFFIRLRLLAQPDMFRKTDPVFSKMRKELNHGVVIKKLCDLDKLYGKITNGSGVSFAGACWYNNALYTLLLQTKRTLQKKPFRLNFTCRWTVAKLDLKSGKSKLIVPWSRWEKKHVKLENISFTVNGKFAVSAYENVIIVFPFNGGRLKYIQDLPGDIVNTLTVMNKRIYAFTGLQHRSRAGTTLLFSCELDGSDRKIHISSSRRNKQNDLDRAKPFVVYGMYADETRKRLIFNCASPNRSGKVAGLWEFYPESGKSACLCNSQRPIDQAMIRAGNMIFFSFWRENFFSYDLKNSKVKLFFSIVDKRAQHYMKVKFRAAQGIFYYPPFFARQNQIWFGGDNNIRMIRLPDYAKSPQIITSFAKNIKCFPHPDGKSAIFINKRNVSVITPKL